MKKFLLVLSFFVLAAKYSQAQESYPTWGQHKTLYLNAYSAGAKNNVLKFPVLVRLDSSNFNAGFAQSLHGGIDIRFTKPGDVVRLPHQIESWDSARKTAAVWVLVDTILSSTNNQFIRMHWGKNSASDSSNGRAVFDTANGFQAVFHMGKGDTTAENDATANAYVADEFNQPVDSTGAIGRSRFFNGTNQRFQIPNSASGSLNFQMTDNYTLSAWMYPVSVSQNTNDGNKIIDKGDNQYVLAIYDNSTPKYWEITTKGNNTWNQCTSNAAFSESGFSGIRTITGEDALAGWHHLVGTYQGAPMGGAVAESLYYDGTLVSTWAGTFTNTTGRTLTFNVNFGVQAASSAPTGSTFTRFWNGMLDEIRLSNRSRTPDWVALEYANQRPIGQTLVTFDAPTVSLFHSGARAVNGTALTIRTLNGGWTFDIAGRGVKANLVVFDMWGRTIWNHTADIRNANPIFWSPRSANGRKLPSGLYFARLTLFDSQNKVTQVSEIKVPMMP